MSLFFFEVFEHVHKSRAAEYEEMSRLTDINVYENEPGMLIHVQTKVFEDAQKVTYRWQETFRSREDYLAHIKNPRVEAHLEKLNDGILCGPLEIVVYCDWDDAIKHTGWKTSVSRILGSQKL